jgi:hypothetical protein
VFKSKIIEIVVLGLWLLIALVLIFRSKESTQFVPPISEQPSNLLSKKYDVKKITVIDGNTFDLSIRNSLSEDLMARILGEIPLKATIDAKKKVIELLNKVENPIVFLDKKLDNGKWIIEISFSLEGKDIQLTSWMKENNLVYN